MAKQNADWDLIIDVMHGSGARASALTPDQQWAVYCEGDGFGYCTPEVLETLNDGWDWSHIRDSSEDGIVRMAAKIRSFLGLEQTTPVPDGAAQPYHTGIVLNLSNLGCED